MKTTAQQIKHSNVSNSLIKKIISSLFFAFIVVFLIFNSVQSLGIEVEASFLKQWAGLTVLIFLWKKFLS